MKKYVFFSLLLLSIGQINSQICFNPITTYGAGAGASSVISSDFNKDGFIDLAFADYTSNQVLIRLGDGAGNFTNGTYLSLGTDPIDLTAADFDNDGNLDLAVANSNYTNSGVANISILLGTGTGTFGPRTNFLAGIEPSCIISADFNGDNKLDLAIGDAAYNGVLTILLGNGSGGFAAGYSPSVNFQPSSLAATDFNEDGKLDLAIGSWGEGLNVMLGVGNGNFNSPTNLLVGNAESVTVADFNGDGHMDVSSCGGNDVSISLGTGTGSFSAFSVFNISGGSLTKIINTDFNGDGKKDVAVSGNSNAMQVLLGTGTGALGSATTFSTSATGSQSVYSADFNGDSKSDIVTCGSANGSAYIFISCTQTTSCVANVSASANTTSICPSSTATLTANGASSFNWSAYPGTLNTTLGNTVIASPTVTTTYMVVADSVGCTPAAATITVNVYSSPTVTIVGPNSQSVCAGATVSAVTFSANPASTFFWTNNNPAIGLAASGMGNISPFTAPSDTTQLIGIINIKAISINNGCTSLSNGNRTYTITINPLPRLTHAYIDSTDCGQNSGAIGYDLNGGGTGGSGSYSYSWNGGAFNYFPSHGSLAGSCTVVVHDIITGCNFSQTYFVPTFATPSPPTIVANSTVICAGGSLGLSVATPTNLAYDWTEANGNVGTGSTHLIQVIPTTPSPYYVTVTATRGGCVSAPSTFTFTANPLPILTIIGDTVCENQTINLSANTTNPIAIYSWTGPNNFASSLQNVAIPNATFAIYGDIYNLQVIDVNGCQNGNSTTIIVNQTPSITVTNPLPYCPGDVIPSPIINTNPVSGVTYTWSVNNTIIGMPLVGTNTPSAYTAPANTTLTDLVGIVSYTANLNGCIGPVANETITIKPTPFMQSLTDQFWCPGNNTNAIPLTTLPPSAAAVFNWSINNGGIPSTGSTNPFPSFVTANSGLTTLVSTVIITPTLNGCVGPDSSFNISVYAAPAASFTLVPDATPHVWDAYPTYSSNMQSAIWYWGDGDSIIALYPSHNYAAPNNYNVCVTAIDTAGCSANYCINDSLYRMTNNTIVTINIINTASGIQNYIQQNIDLYPNPNNGTFIIETNNPAKQIMQIFDVNGRLVLTQTITGKTTINANDLINGVYNINISNSEGLVNKRLVITR